MSASEPHTTQVSASEPHTTQVSASEPQSTQVSASEPQSTQVSASVVRVNPPELAKPSGFSHAVVATGGRTVFLAGQTAMDADGSIVAPGDVVAQFERALGNLLTALRAAGGRPNDLVQVTIYIVDVPAYREQARAIGAVWRQLCGTDYPAAAGIGVSRLWDDDALVEISGTAVVAA